MTEYRLFCSCCGGEQYFASLSKLLAGRAEHVKLALRGGCCKEDVQIYKDGKDIYEEVRND